MTSESYEAGISISVNSAAAQRDLERLLRSIRGLSDSADGAAASVQDVGDSAQRATPNVRRMSDGAQLAAKALKRLAGAMTAAAALAYVHSISAYAVEVDRLAQVAGTSAERMQELAYAGDRVGVSMDEYADILKDVNDKVGDYITTGGGEFADVFQQVLQPLGYTVDQLREMSSEQVLGSVVSGMERLGYTTSQTTYILEALANDATMLAPLYRDNATALHRYSDAADAAGAVSGEMATATRQLTGELAALQRASLASTANVLAPLEQYLADALRGLNRMLGTDVKRSIEDLDAELADLADKERDRGLSLYDQMHRKELMLERQARLATEAIRTEAEARESITYQAPAGPTTPPYDWEAHDEYLQAWQSRYDEMEAIAERSYQTIVATEERYNSMLTASQYQTTAEAFRLLQDVTERGSALNRIAFAAEKATRAAQVIMTSQVAAASALLPPPVGLGPIAGAGMAAAIKAQGYVSAGIIAAQAIAGARQTGGPVLSSSTYRINERGPEILRTPSGAEYLTTGLQGGRIDRLDTATSAAVGAPTVNVVINDYTTGTHTYEAQQTGDGDILVVVRDEIARQAVDPSSRLNRGLSSQYDRRRRV